MRNLIIAMTFAICSTIPVSADGGPPNFLQKALEKADQQRRMELATAQPFTDPESVSDCRAIVLGAIIAGVVTEPAFGELTSKHVDQFGDWIVESIGLSEAVRTFAVRCHATLKASVE